MRAALADATEGKFWPARMELRAYAIYRPQNGVRLLRPRAFGRHARSLEPMLPCCFNRLGSISIPERAYRESDKAASNFKCAADEPTAGNQCDGFDEAGAGNQRTVYPLRHSQRTQRATDRLNLRSVAPVLDLTTAHKWADGYQIDL